MKTCNKCKTEKHESEFYARKNRASGLQSRCKACDRLIDKSEAGKRAHYKYRRTLAGQLSGRQSSRRRLAKKRNVDMLLTNSDIEKIYERFNRQCFKCGTYNSLEIDHHYPLSQGFGLSFNNAVLLCRSCNASKRDKSPEDFYTLKELVELKDRFLV